MDREGLALCSHEEADSGMMAHIADAANTYNSILTGRVDNNIFALAVYAFGELTSSLNKLTGNHYRLMGKWEFGWSYIAEGCTVCR